MDKCLGRWMDMCIARWVDRGDAWVGEEMDEVVDGWIDGQITPST